MGKKYRIKESNYFLRKYNNPTPIIDIEGKLDFRSSSTPASFIYIGRALEANLTFYGQTYYGHIKGLGEFVHETELEELPENLK